MPSALGRMWVIPRPPEFTQSLQSISLEIVIGDFLTAADREVSTRPFTSASYLPRA
jgi:hypothetical protein